MAELAKTHITVTDDSAYAAGIDTLIPLYVFATEQDKVVDESTGEIAIGTTKALANQVSVVTSRKDVVDKFGAPKFYEDNGTVLQGDERNEYGLYGLFDAMGSTSLAYALRADIDLKQLSPVEEEPVSNAKNGTMWLDIVNTSFGIFVCNGSSKPSKAWDEIKNYYFYDGKPEDGDKDVEDGSYAFYYDSGEDDDGLITPNSELIFLEKVDGKWIPLGEGKTIYHKQSTKYPGFDEDKPDEPKPVKGDIWVKTTPTNNGVNYALKKWVASSERWTSVDIQMFGSIEEAEERYGKNLVNGTYIALYDDGSESSESNDQESSANVTFMRVEIVNKENIWSPASEIKVSASAPTEKAEEGTLWFNDDTKVDIMVGNGTVWKGFNNYYPNSRIYTTSAEPESPVENDLWVNPINFPEIKRYIGGEWDLVDNTDQTSPDGIIFADARYYGGTVVVINSDNPEETTYKVIPSLTEPKYTVDDDGQIHSELLTSDVVDPDAPDASTYSRGILLFNTRFSTKNVKEYIKKPFEGQYTEESENFVYTIGGRRYEVAKSIKNIDKFFKNRWVSASGNAADGSGLFGADAQRKMVVKALASAIVSNEDIRTYDYDFFFASCPGYPELDDELINLNIDKKEMFEIISDTPKTLRPDGKAIQEWGTNANNAVSHGTEGRVLKNEYVTRQYPPMGLASNIDGSEIAVPSSIAKMKNLLVLPRGQIAAGTQNGQVTNLASVGYITDEQEYASVVINDGLGEVCTAQSINPIMPRRNTGLLFWGEATENPITSSLSDEHAIITLLRLKRQLEAACLPFFFRINNASLRNEFHKVLQDILNTYIGTGEIYDYALEVESENTPERINRKELWAAIAIEIAKGVEQIYIPIKVVATGALSE